jgi:hypothetical protein
MLRKVRKKLASSISKVEGVEDFNFGNWLKIPLSQEFQIGAINSRLKDLPGLSINIPTTQSSAHSFDIPEPEVGDEIKKYQFKKVRSNAVFFMMHEVTNQGINLPEIEPKPLGYSAMNVDFLIKSPPIKDIRVKFSSWAAPEYKFVIEVPAIFDYLSEMVPTVYNIELLKVDEFINQVENIDVLNVELETFRKSKIKKIPITEVQKSKKIYKVKIPSIGSYKATQKEISFSVFQQPTISESHNVSIPNVKNWFTKVQLPVVDSFLYFNLTQDKLPTMDKKVKGLKNPESVKEILKFVLSSVKKVDWKERKDLHIQLRSYEETGAKFLVEHDYALLQDEFGIDKEKEVIAALKFLFGNRIIRSALIVTTSAKKGNLDLSSRCNIEIGWSDKLNKYCPELPLTVVEGDNDKRTSLWNKSGVLHLSDQATVLNDFRLKILEEKILHRFDCIILDDVHLILYAGDKGKEFLSVLKPRNLWATSGILDKNLLQNVNALLNHSVKIESVKIRDKESIVKEAPKFIWHEEWIKADEDQLKEFKVSMVECQKDLRRVLESGNPLRFTANIFTLLHRLKQVGNFAPGNTKSPKTELLLEQVKTIRDNGKKVLILSQYDRLGTKKIEKLLEQEGINFMQIPAGMAIDEVKKSISLFKSKKEIVALVTDAKISKLDFGNFAVPYIIRFDQWWNPVATWELADMFSPEVDESVNTGSVNVYNYFLMGSIDEGIRELLYKKDVLRKNLFELMPFKVFDELMTIDEWLRLFQMPSGDDFVKITPEDVIKLLNTSTLNFFRTTLSKFFFLLGYSNVDIIDLPNSSSFNVVGEAVRNNRKYFLNARVYIEGKVTKKMIEEIVFETSSSSKDKIFIISKGEFPEGSEKLLRDNVTLLDGHTLAKYLILLEIINSQTTDHAKKLFS